MNCDDVRVFVHGYIDDELDLVSLVQVERHLHDCSGCMQTYDDLRTLRAAIRTEVHAFTAPADLQQRIRLALPAAPSEAPPVRKPRVSRRNWLFGGAALAAVALVVFAFVYPRLVSTTNDQIARDVLSSHVRSLMVTHLADVASTDQHTVKPWFNGKLDFSPPVTDFAAQGFPLIGGRLDYLANQPVAALVYQRRKHVINVFVWPTSDQRAGSLTAVTQQGYHLFHWVKDGMTYWAVSDVNPDELQSFVLLMQGQDTQRLSP